MYLVAGLGNPEKDYKGTRHNIGFEVINKLAFDNHIDINKAKFRAHVGEGRIGDEKVIFVKPQTYMNLSGESIREAMGFYKLTNKELIVIYDETSLALGDIRIREKGSAGGHNGVKNIIYQLNTDEFARIRVGIGEKPSGWDLADYVLSKFKKEEFDKMVDGITDASDALEMILKKGIIDAMNRYNHKNDTGNN